MESETITLRQYTIKSLREIKLILLEKQNKIYKNGNIIELMLNEYKTSEDFHKTVNECVKSKEQEDLPKQGHGVLVRPQTKYELVKIVIKQNTTVIKLVDCMVKAYKNRI